MNATAGRTITTLKDLNDNLHINGSVYNTRLKQRISQGEILKLRFGIVLEQLHRGEIAEIREINPELKEVK